MSVLNRSFSRREKCMLAALIVILLVGLYFFAVHYPIASRMQAIEAENAELDTALAAAEARAAEYAAMNAELDEILSQPQELISIMPPYNNIENLMRMLNQIFMGTNPDFSFGQANVSDEVAVRTVSFTCTAASYTAARELLRTLASSGYRCQLNSFTFTPVQGGDLYNGQLRVSGAVTFYELVEQPAGEAEAEEVPEEGAAA